MVRAVASPLERLDREAAERAFARSAGELIAGNAVRVLHNASENYPAWLEAIAGARRAVLFENYMFDDDPVGRRFAEALMERARAGVSVRVLIDWFGGWGIRNAGLRRRMLAAGVDVRCFSPPQWENPLRWMSRDHRKMLAVDGILGYVSGLCISARWTGAGVRAAAALNGAGIEWRDMGVEIRGPALAHLEHAFADTWSRAGEPLPRGELTAPQDLVVAGDVGVRVIAASPSQASAYQVDQLVAALARRTLWLADAYFIGISLYVQTLRAAAQDGVDVRLLVPGTSDIPMVRFASRVGYRALLEAGVRIFEWNGPMMHAKMAVADGQWARIGSTNLNVSSWINNWELDVAIESEAVARALEDRYEQDLGHATEIVLRGRRWRRAQREGRWRRRALLGRTARGSRAAAGALRLVNRITRRRVHTGPGPLLYFATSIALAILAVVVIEVPRLVAFPAAAVALWAAGTFVVAGVRRLVRRKTYKTPPA